MKKPHEMKRILALFEEESRKPTPSDAKSYILCAPWEYALLKKEAGKRKRRAKK